jgi:hypothetical protein
MVLRSDSRALRVLLALVYPASFLPALLPVRVAPCRIGDNTTDFVRVSLAF